MFPLSLTLLGSLFHSMGPMMLKDLKVKVFLSVVGMTSLSMMLLDLRVWVVCGNLVKRFIRYSSASPLKEV